MLLNPKQSKSLESLGRRNRTYTRPEAETVRLWMELFKARLNDILPGVTGLLDRSEYSRRAESDLLKLFHSYRLGKNKSGFFDEQFRVFGENGVDRESDVWEVDRDSLIPIIRKEIFEILKVAVPCVFRSAVIAETNRWVGGLVNDIYDAGTGDSESVQVIREQLFPSRHYDRTGGFGQDFTLDLMMQGFGGDGPEIVMEKEDSVKEALKIAGMRIGTHKFYERNNVSLIYAKDKNGQREVTVLVGRTSKDATYIFNRTINPAEFEGIFDRLEMIHMLGGVRVPGIANVKVEYVADLIRSGELFLDVVGGMSRKEFAIASVKKAFPDREEFERMPLRDIDLITFPGGIGIRMIWTSVFAESKGRARITSVDLNRLAAEVYGVVDM